MPLKTLDIAEPRLVGRDLLGRDFAELRLRRDQMAGAFEYDHLSFG
ncbi:hypothetical protein [Planosporangium mesophilum]|uniref:Uncharacterized protein n=1 Tax=Planosporangium mesophilum TaxID=689768 RepID=A0A8J3TCR2_9ACTN|nr:hypothetical protein [Planosporangium mesophilum]NJC85772.1 hypothetical protein [Planosporangium mesophilum]GII24760.1 hypothetical protein Pme01_43570 [Planosporangium mesophilum]